MSDATGLDALVDTLLEMRPDIEGLNAPAIEAAYRALLFELGREIAREVQAAPESEPQTDRLTSYG